MAKISKLSMFPLILLVFCAISQHAEAETSIYVFGPDQSNIVKTGGFAGVHETYTVTGQFQLTVDSDAGVASFETVDANLANDTGLVYGRNIDEIFNMTALAGTILDETTIQFEGKTADGTESDVRLNISFSKHSAHLIGKTTPPPNSADMFFYDVNAVATIKYSGGTGEPNNPYQIATAEDLILLGESPEDYDKHFKLMSNIDLSGYAYDRAVIAADIDDVNDGFQGTSFFGVFDGMNHVISNLHIQGGDYLGYLGLFGQLDSGAMVSNLGLEAIDVNGTGKYVGGLVGQNDGSIATSYSTGTVNGSWYFGEDVGGLVGQNNGTITTSYSTGTVTGDENVGGLAGSNGGSIVKSYNTGTVNGRWEVGGLVGMNYGSNTTCHSTGTVTGEWDVGGLTGTNAGKIAMSYSTGTVSGDMGVGGLVGNNWKEITMSYSTGAVNGSVAVGGFAGLNVGIITTSFSTSIVTGNVETGGLVGQNGVNIPTRELNGAVFNCYSTGTVTGDWAVGGLVGANRLGNVDMSYSTGVVTDTDPNSLSPPLPPDDPFDPIYKGAGGLVGGNISNITSCFWDTETSGQTTSDGGDGKTTAKMQTAGTFLDAGWDFAGETENGTEDIWSICEGNNYPRFVWQIGAGDFVCPDGITIDDFMFFMEHWLDDNCDSSNDYCEGTDLDQSGTVDVIDLEIFFENWPAEK
ncbi:MAG: GLUG motif-containing protein [Sedimentisphaerales bacterium]